MLTETGKKQALPCIPLGIAYHTKMDKINYPFFDVATQATFTSMLLFNLANLTWTRGGNCIICGIIDCSQYVTFIFTGVQYHVAQRWDTTALL
jgi:hypothetical protein